MLPITEGLTGHQASLSPRPEVESGISAPKTAYGSKPRSNYGNNRIWVGFRGGISWAATCLEGEAMLD